MKTHVLRLTGSRRGRLFPIGHSSARGFRKLALLGGFMTAALFVFAFAGSASGVPPTPCATPNVLTGSNFEIDVDANLKVDGNATTACIDWLDAGTNNLRSDVAAKADKLSGTGDDSFGQGTSEDNPNPTIVTGSIPPNKSDLKKFGVHTETTSGGKFLQLFWARVQNPSGTTNMDFELNRNACDGTAATCANNGTSKNPVYVTPIRTAGDKLVTYDLSQGGTVPSISIRTWLAATVVGNKTVAAHWSDATVISGGGANATAIGSINSSLISAGESDDVGPLDPFTFGEASISFSAIFGGGTCGKFGSVYLKSRSSDSFTAEAKDFVAPEPVTITNCATLTTSGAESVTIGAAIHDTATLSNAISPTGSITFNVYGPFTGADPTQDTCVAANLAPNGGNIAGSALSGPDANGDYTSTASYTPAAVGRYRWVANYSGDAKNLAAGPTGCLDAGELDTVNKQQPTLATSVAESVTIGAVIHDTATLSGAAQTNSAVGGSITFNVYGPFTGADPTQDSCVAANLAPSGGNIAGSALSSPAGNGDVTSSASYTPGAVGRYRWVANYSGDAKNLAAGPTGCLDAGELDTVNPVQSGISTTQTHFPNDTATITGGGGGTVDFKLYGPFGPNDTPACTGTPVLSVTGVQVSSGSASTNNGPTGTNATQHVSITQDGTYAWLVNYSGDLSHTGATSTCSTEHYTLSVTNG